MSNPFAQPVAGPSRHGGWRRSWSFVAAAIGATLGLGNLWKFAYLAGENGGAVFVLTYLACILLVAAPVLIAEVVLGSRGRANPVQAMKHAALEASSSSLWQIVGWLSVLAGVLILSYYSLIAGWALAYVGKMFRGEFTAGSTQLAGDAFAELLSSPVELLQWQGLFLGLILLMTAAGIRRGLSRLLRVLIPVLLILLLALAIYSSRVGNLDAALTFMFRADFTLLTPELVLAALGHAFFSLSIGTGAMLAYGAYVPDKRSITGMVASVALVDVLVSILAGLVVFPLVFSFNMAPAMGPGLMFIAMPYGFGNMLYGSYFGALFFLMVVLAALGSSVALVEGAIALVVERFKCWRWLAALLVIVVVTALGLISVFSFNRWEGVRLWGMTPFVLLDVLITHALLPLTGAAIALFVGWRMRAEVLRDELFSDHRLLFLLWRGLLRYIAAPGVLVVLGMMVYELWRMKGGG